MVSHQRAQRAIEAGHFKSQILPIEQKTRKGVTLFDTDEHVRFDCQLDDLQGLRPAFKKDGGTVTAGNASGLNDGAAAVVLMERGEAERRGLQPLARLAGYAFAGVEPMLMGIGPVPATRELLAQAGLGVSDIDVWEVNEAFAAQALAVARELDLPADKVNRRAAFLWAPGRCDRRRRTPTHTPHDEGRCNEFSAYRALRGGDDVHRRRYGHGGVI